MLMINDHKRLSAPAIVDLINKSGGVRAFTKDAKQLIKLSPEWFERNVDSLYEAMVKYPMERAYADSEDGMIAMGEGVTALTVSTSHFPILLRERLELVAREKYQLGRLDLGNAFMTIPSRKRSGKFHQLNTDRNIDFVREKEKYPETFISETSDEYTNRKAGEILKITEETLLFDDMNAVIEAVREIADDMKVFEEQQRAIALLGAVYDSSDTTFGAPNEVAVTAVSAEDLGKLLKLGAKMLKPNGSPATIKYDWVAIPVEHQASMGQVLSQAFEDDGAARQNKPVGFKFFGTPAPLVSATIDQSTTPAGFDNDYFAIARGALAETVVIPTMFQTQRGIVQEDGWENDIIARFRTRFLKGFTAKDGRRLARAALP